MCSPSGLLQLSQLLALQGIDLARHTLGAEVKRSPRSSCGPPDGDKAQVRSAVPSKSSSSAALSVSKVRIHVQVITCSDCIPRDAEDGEKRGRKGGS